MYFEPCFEVSKRSYLAREVKNFKIQNFFHRLSKESSRQSQTHFRREKWIKKPVFVKNPADPQSGCFRMFKLIFVCSKYDFWIPGEILDRRR